MLKTIFSLIVVSALTSCEHKELCLHHPHTVSLRIEFDWQDAPDADPAGMFIYFYPEDGGKPIFFNAMGKEGHSLELPGGRYRILAYNNDSEVVQYSNTDHYDLHQGFTGEGNVLEGALGNTAQRAPRANGTEDQPVVLTPDMNWGCVATEVNISDKGVSYISNPLNGDRGVVDKPVYTEYVITMYPHELVCTYTYEIRNVENLKHVTQMCGTLSGMSGAIFMTSEDLHEECVTLPFESAKGDETTIVGQFYTFGHHDENDDPHLMTLYVWMDDGKKYAYGLDDEKFNVTKQIHEAPNQRRVHIIIDGLSLPMPMGDGSGFDATIDEWIEENVDIVM